MNLTYLPLEPYKARYTEQLSAPEGWAETAFADRFDKVVALRPQRANTSAIIHSGKVLDRRERPIWSMEQMIMLAKMEYPNLGKIYFDDVFTPGMESLPYFNSKYQAYGFCWAQSFDQYDFTFPLVNWMRPYEIMTWNIMNRVFVACDLLKELISSFSVDMGLKTEVVGLPFNSNAVAKQRDPAYECPKYDLVYCSRFDSEKQPDFFLDLVAETGLKAAICTGHPRLKGDAFGAIKRANEMSDHGKLDIHYDLSKPQYYAVLGNSHIQFNCALQDWVSFTLLEALTYGCVPLYPNFRAMPETLNYSEGHLYRPFDLGHAIAKIRRLLDSPRNFAEAESILAYHDGTLGRIAQIMFAD